MEEMIIPDSQQYSHHRDSPLEIDFTDLRVEKSIQCLPVDIVVYMRGCNPIYDQSDIPCVSLWRRRVYQQDRQFPVLCTFQPPNRGNHDLRAILNRRHKTVS